MTAFCGICQNVQDRSGGHEMQWTRRKRCQDDSLKKVPRVHGWPWEYRYYATAEDGARKLRVQTLSASFVPAGHAHAAGNGGQRFDPLPQPDRFQPAFLQSVEIALPSS